MLRLRLFAALALAATSAACSILIPPPVAAGESEATLVAQRGQPARRYADGQDRLLEYPQGVWSQQTYMARIGPDGKVISFKQVLTSANFSKIRLGVSTKQDVLKTVGAPLETSYLPLSKLEVWSYPYRENNTWNSVMHIHFDQSGTVRKMVNLPDPRFDPDRRFPFGLLLQ